MESLKSLAEAIKRAKSLNVLTGAGISTLSGIPDFRGPNGVYKAEHLGMDVESILSISFFYEHPDIFYNWASEVWYNLENYEPNIVHKTLSLLESKGYVKNIFTQNIDSLHERAGSKRVYPLHGSAKEGFCTVCKHQFDYDFIAKIVRAGKVPYCPCCGGLIKPDITLYGENLNSYVLNRAIECASNSDVYMVLGSSLTVQPAASLPLYALENRAKLIVVNMDSTYLDNKAYLKFADLNEVFTGLMEIAECW